MKTIKRLALISTISAISFGMVMVVNAQETNTDSMYSMKQKSAILPQEDVQQMDVTMEEDTALDTNTQENTNPCPYHENCDGTHAGNSNCDGSGPHGDGMHNNGNCYRNQNDATPQNEDVVNNEIVEQTVTDNSNPCPYHENCDGTHAGNPNCDGSGPNSKGMHNGGGKHHRNNQ